MATITKNRVVTKTKHYKTSGWYEVILPERRFVDTMGIERVYPANPKWLNEVLDWMIRIERNDYNWTLQGGDNMHLSAVSLFSKLVKIFNNYFDFDKTRLRNIIVK